MGLFKSIGRFFGGRKRKVEQIPRFTPEQQDALNQLLRQGMSDTDSQALEERYKKQFEESTVPSLAEKFTSMGEGQRSSAFSGALGRAGSDLESQLAALRNQSGMNKLQFGLQPQFDTTTTPAQPGMLEGLIGPAFSMLASKALGVGGGAAGGLLGGGGGGQEGGGQGGPQYYPGQPKSNTGELVTGAILKLLTGFLL